MELSRLAFLVEPSWLSLLPPVLAITLAIYTRQVHISLAAGVLLGYTLISGGNPLVGVGDGVAGILAVLQSPGDLRVIAFTLLVGALLATLEASGGVKGFLRLLENRRWVNNGTRSQWLAWAVGIVIFIESSITVLVAGAIARPLFKRFRVSREKLAYIIDSTSAPICILIPLNAWGAFNLGLLDKAGVKQPLEVFVAAVPLNLYAFFAVALVGISIATRFEFPLMRAMNAKTASTPEPGLAASDSARSDFSSTYAAKSIVPRAINMLLPLLTMILSMPVGLWLTGDGNFMEGSGATSVLWAVLSAISMAWGLALAQGSLSINDLTEIFMAGAGKMFPIALVLLLALALGDITSRLETGNYVAGLLSGSLPALLMLPLMFVVAAAIAFSTGSSFGSFAILIPIAVPAAQVMELPLAPMLAAVLSGGVFGDHASPVSDTTILASLAADINHIDHVRTQLPYALFAGTIAIIGFGIMGAVI